MKYEYELPMPVLVDSMRDQSRALFSDLPSPAFVIDAEGIIQAKFPWADAETISRAVSRLKVDKPKRETFSWQWQWRLLASIVFLLFGFLVLKLRNRLRFF